jgi:hypothetical protein
MARGVGDDASANEYRRLFEQGRKWTDANLFNGEYYIQKIRGFRKEEIAPNLRSDMGAENTETPEYQVGEGCMVDQLIGQYLAVVGGMEPLVSTENIGKTLRSIAKYNWKKTLVDWENVARTYVLNDEAAIMVCDYAKTERPRIPFPYFSESWTGLEYSTAALMMHWGMVDEGVECVRNIRNRYDGERRNPWDEPECGHHYARAMSSWSTVIALSGFVYDGVKGSVIAVPRLAHDDFRCFWATATGWGRFSYRRTGGGTEFTLTVLSGTLKCRSCEITAAGETAVASVGSNILANNVERRGGRMVVQLHDVLQLPAKSELRIEVRG